MALIKSVDNPFGGVVEKAYFKVVDLNCNWLTKSCHITLLGWVNQQARFDGKQPIIQRNFDWSGEQFDLDVEQNLLKQVYNKIKTLKVIQPDPENPELTIEFDGEFVGASDII